MRKELSVEEALAAHRAGHVVQLGEGCGHWLPRRGDEWFFNDAELLAFAKGPRWIYVEDDKPKTELPEEVVAAIDKVDELMGLYAFNTRQRSALEKALLGLNSHWQQKLDAQFQNFEQAITQVELDAVELEKQVQEKLDAQGDYMRIVRRRVEKLESKDKGE
jgi:hypothetical protein